MASFFKSIFGKDDEDRATRDDKLEERVRVMWTLVKKNLALDVVTMICFRAVLHLIDVSLR